MYINGVTRSQKKRDKYTNNGPQNVTKKTTDLAALTPLKTRGDLRYSRKLKLENDVKTKN